MKLADHSLDPTVLFEGHGGIHVPRLVRYFKKSRLPDTRNGRFWFSTLSGFRKGEELRFSDDEEGNIIYSFDIEGRFAKGIEVPPFSLRPEGGPKDYSIKGGRVHLPVDAFAMCFSIGPYDRSHHREMLDRNGDLTEFAEIDTAKLLAALSHLGKKKGLIEPPHIGLWATAVRYEDRIFSLKLRAPEHDGFSFKDIKHYAWTRAAFYKPHRFNYEREYRVVFRASVPEGDNGILMESHHIKRSILRTGHY